MTEFNQLRKSLLSILLLCTFFLLIALVFNVLAEKDKATTKSIVSTSAELNDNGVPDETKDSNQIDKAEEQVESTVEAQTDLSEDSAPEQQVTSVQGSIAVSVINCIDCTLAPVDKDNQIPANYNPGGILVEPQANLDKLIAAALESGISVEVISGFRSFNTQADTFNYWVGIELGSGKTQSQAEADANVYSAKPGHSEHQLGTTFDVKCSTCAAFDIDSNAELNNFLEENAHNFGFVVSYPKNSEALTGYTYEPWHIRWIGEELATELYNTGYINGNGNYLSQFLRDKGY